VGGRLVAVKSASTELEVAALAHEADLLRRAAHPGVVPLVSFTSTADRAELVLNAPSEYTVAQRLPESMAACLDFVAAIADTVADLHAMGIAHGAIRPDHVLVGPNEQPVLCGFGNAQAVVDPQLFSADVVALGEILAWLARRMPPDRRIGRIVTAVVTRSRDADATARALAFAMIDHRRRSPSVGAALARKPALGAFVAIGAIATGTALFAHDNAPIAATPSTSVAQPSATASDAGDVPQVEVRGTIYRLGQVGDRAFFVPCEGHDRVVLIRPASGDLFVFDDFAAVGAPRTARSVGRIEGAIEVLPSTDHTCSEFVVATDEQLLDVPVPTSRSR
jgi:tRNA A-37 threonylcarbamoyl transferase component Bud32